MVNSVRNSAFGLAKEERTQSGFFKFIHCADLSSEKIREIPQDLITELTSYTMVLRTVWGMSWEVEILKNPRFCYMEKRGWDKFVSDNALGDSEFVTFTHKGNMSFNVTIFKQNGTEMMRPPLSMASSTRIKSEEEEQDMRTADTTGGATNKRELNSAKKKAVRTDSAGPSSSSAPKFTIVIRNSHKHRIKMRRGLQNQL